MLSSEQYKAGIKRILTCKIARRITLYLGVKGIAILCYHSVLENPKKFYNSIGEGIIHSADLFDQQMRILKQEFNPITIEQVYAYCAEDTKIPKRSVVVSFDDGFADNYHVAAPIMEHYGIFGTFYITVAAIQNRRPPWFVRLRNAFFTSKNNAWINPSDGTKIALNNYQNRYQAFIQACQLCAITQGEAQQVLINQLESMLEVEPPDFFKNIMMTWDQIRTLYSKGHTIGSHTISHPNLAHIDGNLAFKELLESKRCMENELNIKVRHFSYPVPILEPHWNKDTVRITEQIGYKTAVTCSPGLIRMGDSPLSLKRISAPQSILEYRWSLETLFAGFSPR